VTDWAADVGDSSVVVGMSRNGTTFGVRLAGGDGRWFTAPAPPVGDALYHPGYGPEDAAPDIGDSAVLELIGLGGACIALVGAVGLVPVAGGALVWALQAQEQQANPPAPQAQTQVAPAAGAPATGPETIAFTFTDETQMQQFAQVWGQRQGALTRMAVLQAYWNQEQAGLGQLNQELLSKYNLDVNKNYTLDTDRKVLVEQPLTPEQVAAQAAIAGGTTPGQADQAPANP
jgi:hypothetical protein